MNQIDLDILKIFGLRAWMLIARLFTTLSLFYAHYLTPSWVFIAAMCISLPLVGVAAYRCIETLRLWVEMKPQINKAKEIVLKDKNKQYRDSL